MRTVKEILSANIKLYKGRYPDKDLNITPSMRGIIYDSMLQMAGEVRNAEDKKIIRESFGVIPNLWLTRLSMWAKRVVRNQYVRQAQLRADTECYKVYVLQGKGLTFKLISTRDFKFNKAIRVFKKDLTAKEMEKLSCYIAYPKKK